MSILAVDPGLRGALARYDGEHLSVLDMPTTIRQLANGRTRDTINEAEIVHMIGLGALEADLLVMEQVGGIPNQSASGAFTFGRGVGVVIGAAISVGLRREEVHPATWKGALRVPADKRAARARASELLPAYSGLWPLQKHEGRAEASLLALYGWRVFGPNT
jgi:hypothetical protein